MILHKIKDLTEVDSHIIDITTVINSKINYIKLIQN